MVDIPGVSSFIGANVAGGFLGARGSGQVQSRQKFNLEGSAGVQHPNAVENVAQNAEIFEAGVARRAENLGVERSLGTDRSTESDRSFRVVQDEVRISNRETADIFTDQAEESILNNREEVKAFQERDNEIVAEAQSRDAIRDAFVDAEIADNEVKAEAFARNVAVQDAAEFNIDFDASRVAAQSDARTQDDAAAFADDDAQRVQQSIRDEVIARVDRETITPETVPSGQAQFTIEDELVLRKAAGTVIDTDSLENPPATSATTDTDARQAVENDRSDTDRTDAPADAAGSAATDRTAERAPPPQDTPGADPATQDEELTGVPSAVDIFA